jgi:hypothetical protein
VPRAPRPVTNLPDGQISSNFEQIRLTVADPAHYSTRGNIKVGKVLRKKHVSYIFSKGHKPK